MKKNWLLFFIIVVLTIIRIDVFANTLSIDDVVNKVSNGDLKAYYDSFDMELSVTNDSANKKIVISTSTGILFEAGYTDEYIEYVNNDDDVTADEFEEDISTYLGVAAITDAILDLAGYGDKTIDDTYSYNDFDTYGLIMTAENMDFTATGGGKGDFIRSYKISLDTNKIDKLIEDYGKETNENQYSNLTANVTAENITSTSLYIKPAVINYNHTGSESDVPLCQVFKSESENGEFKLANNASINCTGVLSMLVDDLKPNTTYYFKAKVVGSDIYGDVLKVATLSNAETNDQEAEIDKTTDTDNKESEQGNESTNESTNEEKKNPKTGISDYYLFLIIIMVLGSTVYLLIRNKNFIKQI